MKANKITLKKGRVKFGDGKNSAPYQSAIVEFKTAHTHTQTQTDFGCNGHYKLTA
ncbi:hypothetical protein [Staphylococcus felis]|uniref:hypothetical protein n=1 Tax=Staphylococcus felis TaxID=46127 RepID=UPI0015F28555|nr:hypothetical protein [Staphylococcus felis]